MLNSLVRRTAPLAALAAILGAGIAVPVIGQDSSSPASAATSPAPASTATPSNDDLLAQGKHIWTDAACFNCHGTNGQGGHSADFPAGPNLRTSGLDPRTMLMIVECGLPTTKMPAWLKGAYTEVSCNGSPVGPVPTDTLISGAYGENDLKALVDYLQVNFMKQPMPTWSAQ